MEMARIAGYLQGATDQELATLAQQGRDPSIISAVQAEMDRRRSGIGGLTPAEMSTPAPPPMAAAPLPQPTQLAEVADTEWVPPWARNDGKGPFPALVREGPVADDTPEDPWLRGAREKERGRLGSPYLAREMAEGPVPDWYGEMDGESTIPEDPWLRGALERTRPDVPARVRAGEPPLQEEFVDELPPTYDADADTDVDLPGEAIELARALETAGEDPDAMQALIAEIQGSIQSPEDMRNMAIAKAGFGMAASRSPYFFGALGEGAGQGLEAYEKSKQEALLNRVRAAQMQQGVDEFGERKRATGVSEAQGEKKIEQANRQLDMAEREYERKVKEFDEGKATRDELARAEIRLRNAQANYAEQRPRSTSKADLLVGNDGFLMRLTPEGGAEYVTDPDGNKIKGQRLSGSGSGQTAMQRNARDVADALFEGDYAKGLAWMRQGSTMAPDVRYRTAYNAAVAMAAADPMLFDSVERETFIAAKAREIEEALAEAAASSTGTPVVPTAGAGAETGGGAYLSREDVRAAYKAGKITKEQAREEISKLTAE